MLIILKIGTILGLMWQNHPIYSSYTKIMESISGTYKILPSSPHTLTKKPIPNSNFFLTNTINLVKKNRQPRQKKKICFKDRFNLFENNFVFRIQFSKIYYLNIPKRNLEHFLYIS